MKALALKRHEELGAYCDCGETTEIADAFEWGDTPEGEVYWALVDDFLRGLRPDCPMPPEEKDEKELEAVKKLYLAAGMIYEFLLEDPGIGCVHVAEVIATVRAVTERKAVWE